MTPRKKLIEVAMSEVQAMRERPSVGNDALRIRCDGLHDPGMDPLAQSPARRQEPG